MITVQRLTRVDWPEWSCASCGRPHEQRGSDWVIVNSGALLCLNEKCARQHMGEARKMIDITEREEMAMKAVLPSLKAFVQENGSKPISEYTYSQIMRMIETIVDEYGQALAGINDEIDEVPF